MRRVDLLRRKYPRFVYKGFGAELRGRDLRLTFDFRTAPRLSFRPEIIIKNIHRARFHKINDRTIQNFAFHLGLIEMLSYWKATCSPEIVIEAGYLNKKQIRWWRNLITNGMGQFFYENKIDFRAPKFLRITVRGKKHSNILQNVGMFSLHNTALKKQHKNLYLVPVGGGRDAIVTLEALKKQKKEANAFMLNPTRAAKDVAKIARIKNPIIVERKIDPALLKLNKKRYLNGHTPFTALLSFLSVFCAVLFDYRQVVFSNEKSADEGNIKYLGMTVNHQYSKSSEFEKKFRRYCKKYLAKNINYFSFLRKYGELEISKMFAGYPQYFSVFSSCNTFGKLSTSRAIKLNRKWCGGCPKCLFVYMTLYPFLDEKVLLKIFGKDLFENKKLLPTMEALIDEKGLKPFECVGTKRETMKALELSKKKFGARSKMPYLLDIYETKKSLGKKKVLILGFGREGKDTHRFLQAQFPEMVLGIADKNPYIYFRALNSKSKSLNSKPKRSALDKIRLHLGKNYLRALRQYDVIIKSPGIPPKLIEPYTKKGQIITSQTEIFFDNCPGTIIGITGTKGKSTTTSMIYHILKKAGFKAHLVGNIGRPALSSLSKATKKDIFVYELSSHQLYNLKKSPHIAVFLNIFPEHLDYYRSFKEYARVKANICRWQTKNGYVVFNSQDKRVSEIVQKSKAKKIPIKGKYYELDRQAVRAVGKIIGIPKKKIEGVLKNFVPLPHRLELVGKVQGITFYNDSLSTIPQSAMEALDYLGDKVQTFIAGGFDRGVDFKNLAARIHKSNIKTLILFPPSGLRIVKELKKRQKQQRGQKRQGGVVKLSSTTPQRGHKDVATYIVNSMQDAVRIAFERTLESKVCLLSPASPSFGLFKDYKERGNLFKKYISKREKGKKIML